MEPPPPYERTPSLASGTSVSSRVSVLDIERAYNDNMNIERRDRFKLMMPRMHMYMAATCAVINFILPGFGTILAAFSLFFCCTKSSDLTAVELTTTFCIGVMIGLLQITLVPVFLIGWVWSIIWGLAMIGVSDEKYHGNLSSESSSVAGSASGISVPSASHVHLSRSSSINSSIGPNSFPFEVIYASTANVTPGTSIGAETTEAIPMRTMPVSTIPNTPPPPYDAGAITQVST